MKVKIDIKNLMAQAAAEMNCTGITMGFKLAEASLHRIAERAIKLNDKKLLDELETLCIIEREE